jgi:catechol 2,3-dioxygenase-like lactoylglutathione lyase family enzyme
MGIHHIKFAVTDLDRSLHFYEAFLGANALRRPITGERTMDRCTLTSSKCLG